MAITEVTPITRNTSYTISSDDVMLESISLVFYTTKKDGLPTQDARLVISYIDGSRQGSGDTKVVMAQGVTFNGASQVAGTGSQPFSESTYNAIVSDIQDWLDANI